MSIASLLLGESRERLRPKIAKRNFLIGNKNQDGAISEIHLKKNWYFFPKVK